MQIVISCSRTCAVLYYDNGGNHLYMFSVPIHTQAYKAVVNDATIFKLELPLKQKG